MNDPREIQMIYPVMRPQPSIGGADEIVTLCTDRAEADRIVEVFGLSGREAYVAEAETIDCMTADEWRAALADDIAEEAAEHDLPLMPDGENPPV